MTDTEVTYEKEGVRELTKHLIQIVTCNMHTWSQIHGANDIALTKVHTDSHSMHWVTEEIPAIHNIFTN